ncbi:putative aryl-alcohol dehydrogenase [Aspergillus floccosus]
MTRPDTESAIGLENALFDFVVVGGGTSGLVVANRLTENAKIRVLVIEAGGNKLDDIRLQAPGLARATYGDPEFDWDFRSIPQTQLNGRQVIATRGRTLGGSSAINVGTVIYPSKSGLDAWEELGNPGWGWDGVAPYVRKFNTTTAPSQSVHEFFPSMKHEQKDHGTGGPVQVSFADEYMPYHAAWMEAFKNLGYLQTGDPINGEVTGPFVSTGIVDPRTHTRSHAGAAYFNQAAQNRPNLRVLTGALVEKLVLEQRVGAVVATAVQFSKGSRMYTVAVNREVILAAGAVNTPQLLEMSGVGNSELLRAHGINPIIDNPAVGENLQDHGFVPFGYEVADGMPSGDMARDPAVAAAFLAAFQKDGSGPLGMLPFTAALMPCLELSDEERQKLLQKVDDSLIGDIPRSHKKQYEALRKKLQDPNAPTGMYFMAPSQILPRAGPNPQDVLGMSHPGYFVSFLSFLCHPFSRGSIHLQSGNPRDAPLIDHATLCHPVDLELHARHNVWMDRIADTEPFISLLKPHGMRLHTPDRVTQLDQSEELCKELILSMYHLCGTCAMMPREDGGVVDPELKVYDTANIRVVDASIFPLVPLGNIQATVFAVAEKAADIIKQRLE